MIFWKKLTLFQTEPAGIPRQSQASAQESIISSDMLVSHYLFTYYIFKYTSHSFHFGSTPHEEQDLGC